MLRLLITVLAAALVAGCSERQFRQGGSSAMWPTIKSNEVISADMSAYRKVGPQRWDVIVFQSPILSPESKNQIWVMRVVGLPGESISIEEDGIYVGDRLEPQPARLEGIRYLRGVPDSSVMTVSYPYTVPPESYFLLGDNTTNACDSRFWGALSKSNILGRVKHK